MDVRWYKQLEWYAKTPKVRRVLFVCSGNTCRSPSAAYYFNTTASWWSGLKAFSRGVEVTSILATLRAKGIKIKSLMMEEEPKKVIGDRLSEFLAKHKAQQISSKDIAKADLIVTMEKGVRDRLKREFSPSAYKIFTLKGFVERTENGAIAELDIGNPFLPPAIKRERGVTLGNVAYLRYLQNYAKILELIKAYVRRLIEILYLLREERKK